jgi:K+-sensing histidine kinase KdpD
LRIVGIGFPGISRWLIGALVCTAAAGVMTAIFGDRAGRENLPLVFLSVITLVALYFGALAGVLGSISAAIIFTLFLFPPIWSPLVHDLGERSNVGWMLLGGIAISYLFAPRSSSNPPSEQ